MVSAAQLEPRSQPARNLVVEPPRFAVRHYTVNEIAQLWSLSDDAVRKIFENEPGVLAIGEARSGRKRRYVTLRIPEDVAERVHRRLARV